MYYWGDNAKSSGNIDLAGLYEIYFHSMSGRYGGWKRFERSREIEETKP